MRRGGVGVLRCQRTSIGVLTLFFWEGGDAISKVIEKKNPSEENKKWQGGGGIRFLEHKFIGRVKIQMEEKDDVGDGEVYFVSFVSGGNVRET